MVGVGVAETYSVSELSGQVELHSATRDGLVKLVHGFQSAADVPIGLSFTQLVSHLTRNGQILTVVLDCFSEILQIVVSVAQLAVERA